MKKHKIIFLIIPIMAITFILSFLFISKKNIVNAETVTDNNFYSYEYYGLDDFRSYNSYTFSNIDTVDGVSNLTHDFRTLAKNPVLTNEFYDDLHIINSEDANNKSLTVYLKLNTYYFIKVNYITADSIFTNNSYELFIHNRSWSTQIRYQLYNHVQTLPDYDYNYDRVFLFNTSIFDNNDYYYDGDIKRDVVTYNDGYFTYYPFIISNSYADYFYINFSIYEVLDFPLDYFSGLDSGIQISYSTNTDYQSSYLYGKDVGYTQGYDVGYNSGYDMGYNSGYNTGYSDGETVGYSSKGVFHNIVDSLSSIFEIRIGGDFGLSIGGICLMGVVILSFFALIKMLR